MMTTHDSADTPAQLEARAKIKQLLSDPTFRKAYYADATSPQHQAAVKQIADLMERSDPSAAPIRGAS